MVIVLAAAGVAGGVFFLMRDGDEAAATRDAAGVAQPDRDVPTLTPAERRAAARSHGTHVKPEGEPGAAGPAADEPEVSYMEDGTRVADHRKTKEPYLRPGVPHPSMSPVDGKVSTAVLQQLRPIVIKCLASVPDDAFTDQALVMARAVIAIDAQGNLTALELGADGTGLDPERLAPAVECIRAAAGSVQAHVDHEAVETATLAFPIRPLAYRR